jgi:hypothetical protein
MIFFMIVFGNFFFIKKTEYFCFFSNKKVIKFEIEFFFVSKSLQ